jgi:chaperonin cofactor prefoldin
MAEILSLQSEMENEFKEMQNLQKLMKKLVESRQQLIEQLSECEIVKKV